MAEQILGQEMRKTKNCSPIQAGSFCWARTSGMAIRTSKTCRFIKAQAPNSLLHHPNRAPPDLTYPGLLNERFPRGMTLPAASSPGRRRWPVSSVVAPGCLCLAWPVLCPPTSVVGRPTRPSLWVTTQQLTSCCRRCTSKITDGTGRA